MKETYRNEYRESLLDRMIKIYGFEHKAVIEFAEMCLQHKHSTIWDGVLASTVEDHEAGEYRDIYGGDE